MPAVIGAFVPTSYSVAPAFGTEICNAALPPGMSSPFTGLLVWPVPNTSQSRRVGSLINVPGRVSSSACSSALGCWAMAATGTISSAIAPSIKVFIFILSSLIRPTPSHRAYPAPIFSSSGPITERCWYSPTRTCRCRHCRMRPAPYADRRRALRRESSRSRRTLP
jgi:hypothetical protein